MVLSCLAFLACMRGSTAVEYGLLAALLGVVLVVSLTALGVSISTVFNTLSDALND